MKTVLFLYLFHENLGKWFEEIILKKSKNVWIDIEKLFNFNFFFFKRKAKHAGSDLMIWTDLEIDPTILDLIICRERENWVL